ncbi:MAG: hypothetical protein DIU69_03805 [Bacillota bacterium]|nr:MAG: hypothetical protein DIU69_03805 [Bacillota bacterium]
MARCLDLSGTWEVRVPGAAEAPRPIRVPDEPPVPLGRQVPSAVYRYRFELGSAEVALPGARLELDGVLGGVRVRLNGADVGHRPAGMAPLALPVAGFLRAGSNDLEIEVRAPGRDGAERALWGAYERPECLPAGTYPPGLTGPARLVLFDGVTITGVYWLVRPEGPLVPGEPPAVVHVRCRVAYVATRAVAGRCRLRLRPEGFVAPGVEAAYDVEATPGEGAWDLWCSLPSPRLWTVWERGRPHLYRLEVLFEEEAGAAAPKGAPGRGTPPAGAKALGSGQPAPGVACWTGYVGIRTVEFKDGIFHLNGEPLFCRGACLLPPPRWPGATGGRQAAAFVRRARTLQLNALRVYAHRAHPAVYEAASRLGIVLWQDVPLTGDPRPGDAEALRCQLPGWVQTVGAWPAVIAWSASQEPAAPPLARAGGPAEAAGGSRRWGPVRWPALLRLPVTRRAVRAVARELAELDPGRPVIERAGAFNLWRGGDARLFPGRWTVRAGDPAFLLRVVPYAATLVSSFGVTATGQAAFARAVMEALRRRRAQPSGGGFLFALNDAWPGTGYGLYDAEGRPRPAARAYREACLPARLLAEPPRRPLQPGGRLRLPLWLVNDTARRLHGSGRWEVRAGDRLLAAQTFLCEAGPGSVVPAGWAEVRLPASPDLPVVLVLRLEAAPVVAEAVYLLPLAAGGATTGRVAAAAPEGEEPRSHGPAGNPAGGAFVLRGGGGSPQHSH